MSPSTQLIQLTLRIEREAEEQRRPSRVYSEDLANERRFSRPSETVESSVFSVCFSPTTA